MHLVAIFARDGELIVGYAYGRGAQLGDVESVYAICTVDTDEIAGVENR